MYIFKQHRVGTDLSPYPKAPRGWGLLCGSLYCAHLKFSLPLLLRPQGLASPTGDVPSLQASVEQAEGKIASFQIAAQPATKPTG